VRPEASSDRAERTFIEAARRAQIVQPAIDTIAEAGHGNTSLSRIGARIGISKGLIGYHLGGKDDPIRQVASEIQEQGKAYMRPLTLAHSTGPDMLRAYIEWNLGFMKEHRNHTLATVEIARHGVSAGGRSRFYGDADVDTAVQALEALLVGFQAARKCAAASTHG
jgi:AcrR family transcriptional regulator